MAEQMATQGKLAEQMFSTIVYGHCERRHHADLRWAFFQVFNLSI